MLCIVHISRPALKEQRELANRMGAISESVGECSCREYAHVGASEVAQAERILDECGARLVDGPSVVAHRIAVENESIQLAHSAHVQPEFAEHVAVHVGHVADHAQYAVGVVEPHARNAAVPRQCAKNDTRRPTSGELRPAYHRTEADRTHIRVVRKHLEQLPVALLVVFACRAIQVDSSAIHRVRPLTVGKRVVDVIFCGLFGRKAADHRCGERVVARDARPSCKAFCGQFALAHNSVQRFDDCSASAHQPTVLCVLELFQAYYFVQCTQIVALVPQVAALYLLVHVVAELGHVCAVDEKFKAIVAPKLGRAVRHCLLGTRKLLTQVVFVGTAELGELSGHLKVDLARKRRVIYRASADRAFSQALHAPIRFYVFHVLFVVQIVVVSGVEAARRRSVCERRVRRRSDSKGHLFFSVFRQTTAMPKKL